MNKSYQYFLLRQPIKGVNSELEPENTKDQTDLYYLISKQTQFRGWMVHRTPQIPRGKYDIITILELVKTQFHLLFSNKTIDLKIDSY